MRGPVCLLVMPDYKPGDPAPSGYLEWHEWAGVQAKAGLRQKQCGRCGRWKFPQELSNSRIESNLRTSSGERVIQRAPICLECNPTVGAEAGKPT